jgi:REP element-mobilizing transposase RayT
MARSKRLKLKDEEGFFHIMSRTVGQEFYLGDVEKEKLFNIIKYYSGFYFVKVIGLTIMSNHFHLLIKSEPESYYSDEQVKQRIEKYMDKDKNKKRKKKKKKKDKEEQEEGEEVEVEEGDEEISNHKLLQIKKQMADISEYVRAFKQTFSRWYNKMNNRTGYFWGDRFKSVLIEKGEALINCLAYIDLNPVRARIVTRPEDYRWSGIGYRIYTDNKGDFLSFEGIFSESEIKDLPKEELLKCYRYFVYKCGNIKRLSLAEIEAGADVSNVKSVRDDATYRHELMRDFKLPTGEIMLGRIRHFSQGMVIGSKQFLKEAYAKYGGEVIVKKDRNVYQTGITNNILSLRKLIC